MLASRNADIRLPCCVKARSPTEFGMVWSVLTASLPANACTLLASIQLQKLTHGPHRTELFEEFWETHITRVSKPDSNFLPFNKSLQNDVLLTKVNKNSCYDLLRLGGNVYEPVKCRHMISVGWGCGPACPPISFVFFLFLALGFPRC